jgi:hypothetical protein
MTRLTNHQGSQAKFRKRRSSQGNWYDYLPAISSRKVLPLSAAA